MNLNENSNSNNKQNKNEPDSMKDDNLNLINDENQYTLEEDKYVFGWGQYSEITNGRFAMIGFAAIILIEIISKKSFLHWAGIIN
tara:strand:+ start:391 stop:645 length:255 start_codon:yes stop_codon:yes gene_type:complete